jgi:putative tryptophan/tyrosine transport system substrate-binding protein
MRRRDFIKAIAGSTAAWPTAAAAQQPAKIRRIGFLWPGARAFAPVALHATQSALEAGGLRGEEVEIIQRIADDNVALVAPMAAELVALNVDLIQALSPAAIRAARAATAKIPIVGVDLESDPVASGFIISNTRPGGNITGVFLDFPDFSKKWLEALKEAVPHAANVAVMWDPGTGPNQLKAVEAAASTLGFTLTLVEVRLPTEIDPAFQSAVQKGARALLMLSSPLTGAHTKLLAGLALKHRLPAITLFTDFARDGGLMAYGPNLRAFLRQGGVMAAKILLGANPAATPIETPAKFEFVLNLKTAKLLGLTIPASILLRADEVIE